MINEYLDWLADNLLDPENVYKSRVDYGEEQNATNRRPNRNTKRSNIVSNSSDRTRSKK